MKIRIKKNIKERLVGFEEEDLEKEFAVLSVEQSSKGIFFRIITNAFPSSALFECEYFEIISKKIPENWVINIEDSNIILMPKSWFENDILEKVYDVEKEATKIFEEEIEIILNSDPVENYKPEEIKSFKKAEILNECWLMCPHCIDAWESNNQKSIVICPKCNNKLINPRLIN